MMRGRGIVGIALVALFAVSAAACSSTDSSGSVKISSKALCENAGGKYSQGTCMPGSPKKADVMCQGFGGIFLTDEDLCHIPPK